MRPRNTASLVVSLLGSALCLFASACGDDDVAPIDAATLPLDAPAADAGPRELAPCSETAGSFAPLATRCRQFIDDDGRVVFLRGVNARVEGLFDVGFDDGRETLEPIPPFGPSDANRLRALGFNVLRLPINWSALEPTTLRHRRIPARISTRSRASWTTAARPASTC